MIAYKHVAVMLVGKVKSVGNINPEVNKLKIERKSRCSVGLSDP